MASSTRNVETETQEIPDLTTTIKVRILGYQNIVSVSTGDEKFQMFDIIMKLK